MGEIVVILLAGAVLAVLAGMVIMPMIAREQKTDESHEAQDMARLKRYREDNPDVDTIHEYHGMGFYSFDPRAENIETADDIGTDDTPSGDGN